MEVAQNNSLMIILCYVVGALAINDAILLFLKGRHNKAKRILAFLSLCIGILYLGRAILFHTGWVVPAYTAFRPLPLEFGILFNLLMLLFPLEIVRPGWVNLRHVLMLALPLLCCVGIYAGGLWLTGEKPEVFMDLVEIGPSLGHFNVWFRFVFVLLSFALFIYATQLTIRYKKHYEEWQHNYFTDDDNMDVSWLYGYQTMVCIIFISWLMNVFLGQIWCYIVHTILTVIALCFGVYKVLDHKSAYMDESFCDADEETAVSTVSQDQQVEKKFEEQLPEYVRKLVSWLEQDQPYLYQDFKLMHVAQVIPLNRSYLSRLFNEGLGKNFNEVIQEYRIRHALVLMKENPDLPLYIISEKSGFSSRSTFVKAFSRQMGMAPSVYRSHLEEQAVG